MNIKSKLKYVPIGNALIEMVAGKTYGVSFASIKGFDFDNTHVDIKRGTLWFGEKEGGQFLKVTRTVWIGGGEFKAVIPKGFWKITNGKINTNIAPMNRKIGNV